MTCLPSQMALHASALDRERIRSRAEALIARFPTGGFAAKPVDPSLRDAALATALMDLFRRSADADVFDCLVQWTSPQLYSRIRSRLRGLGALFDPQEILQDTIVNVYRYPDRFAASRPGAFAAWSSTIVDNAIRRQLRHRRQVCEVSSNSSELLQERADEGAREPSLEAQDHEECAATMRAFTLLLHCYLAAYATLSERERFVLQMVEVREMRYAELALVLGIRAEALKMVVFRARKRVLDRLAVLIDVPAAGSPVPRTTSHGPSRSVLALACA